MPATRADRGEPDPLLTEAGDRVPGVNLSHMALDGEARFRAFNDLSPIGIFHCDREGVCSYVNERWLSIFGDAALGEGPPSWIGSVHPEDRWGVLEAWYDSVAQLSDFDRDFRVLDAAGQARFLRCCARPIPDEQGRTAGFVGTVEDLTELHRTLSRLRRSEDRLRRLYERTPAMLHSIDAKGRLISVSDLWLERMEYQRDEVLGRLSSDFLTVESQAYAQKEVLPAFFETGVCENVEYQMVTRSGRVLDVLLSAILERDENGQAIRSVAVIEDVTEARRVEAVLAQEHELLRVTLESIGDAVITTDARACVNWLNPVAERMTGWTSEDARGCPLTQIFRIENEATRQPAPNPVTACLKLEDLSGMAERTVLVSRDGEEFGIEDSASPIRNEEGDVLGAILVFRDVTEQRRLSSEMTYRATHDVLTGLINRTEFEARLQRTLKQAAEQRSRHALMYIDLDQFKLLNDSCGHTIGDQLLQQIGKLFAEVLSPKDILARLGGDEFGVIVEHAEAEQAQQLAERICEVMEDFRFAHDGRSFRIGASIGLVMVDERWPSAVSIMQAADGACYAAKEGGRNRVHVWRESDVTLAERHGEMQWATRIEEALDEGRFVLYAQRMLPLAAPADGVHAEALLRMVDRDGRLILPAAFVPAAERFHLISRIDRWVIRHVVDWLRSAPDVAHIALIGVNLSGHSIGDRAFHRYATDLLSDAGPELCRRLCLEITETAAVTNIADASIFIERVRALGVSVALDDFGSGTSSFGYLKMLAVDTLKIDGQFIQGLLEDPLDEVAVRSFCDVARVMKLRTVAEFVDRPAILDKLREIGVGFAQGFVMHRAEPIDGLLNRFTPHGRSKPRSANDA